MTFLDPLFGNWRAILLCLAGSVLLIAAAYIKGRSDGRAAVQLQLERANTAYLREKGRADDLAAERRLTDTIAVNQRERELIDAVRQAPDGTPDAASIALGCERLRRQNPGAALPPACGRPSH